MRRLNAASNVGAPAYCCQIFLCCLLRAFSSTFIRCRVNAMATQRELARLAGVSAGTVSNVISGSARVSDSARRKVLAAIQQLNYRPNLIARSLKTNRTHTLGIVVPDIT